YLQRAPSPSGLVDVLDLILDKGLVIDAYVRVSVIGIELLTIDARIVVASVDTYLRFAEAVNRLDLTETELAGLPELQETGAIAKRAAASLAATAAGAATTYALRHGPKLLREQVLPKLRERGRTADGGLPTRAATSSRTQTGGAAERGRRAQRRSERQRAL